MSVNREKWHLLIKPEDDANRQIANGFVGSLDLCAQKKIQILPTAGGYLKALEFIESAQLDQFPNRRLLILMDFDEAVELRNKIVEKHASFSSRVFVVGANPEAEDLRRELNCHLDECGVKIAGSCNTSDCTIWDISSLNHNSEVLKRLCPEIYKELINHE